ILAENNLAYNTTHGGFHQHYGRDNVVRNNIFAFGRDAQIQRTRIEPHRSFTFERNLVFWHTGELLAGDWEELHADLDRNLYWRTAAAEGPITFAGRSWDEWQKLGADVRSRIADGCDLGLVLP
ncbi:MAG: right-handed parallel beta-helix repeat-containing protein, partial [Planctomycetaceae bacterium]|nr:right-handed parallel beta-helix repeat-containing protein [Planctomycetaceae bacterium]